MKKWIKLLDFLTIVAIPTSLAFYIPTSEKINEIKKKNNQIDVAYSQNKESNFELNKGKQKENKPNRILLELK